MDRKKSDKVGLAKAISISSLNNEIMATDPGQAPSESAADDTLGRNLKNFHLGEVKGKRSLSFNKQKKMQKSPLLKQDGDQSESALSSNEQKLRANTGVKIVLGETEYTCYQSKGYDLTHVSGRLAVYRKKILSRATHKDSRYMLEEDKCKIKFQILKKESKKSRKGTVK